MVSCRICARGFHTAIAKIRKCAYYSNTINHYRANKRKRPLDERLGYSSQIAKRHRDLRCLFVFPLLIFDDNPDVGFDELRLLLAFELDVGFPGEAPVDGPIIIPLIVSGS